MIRAGIKIVRYHILGSPDLPVCALSARLHWKLPDFQKDCRSRICCVLDCGELSFKPVTAWQGNRAVRIFSAACGNAVPVCAGILLFWNDCTALICGCFPAGSLLVWRVEHPADAFFDGAFLPAVFGVCVGVCAVSCSVYISYLKNKNIPAGTGTSNAETGTSHV